MATETIERAHALADEHPRAGARTRLRWARTEDNRPTWAVELADDGTATHPDGWTLTLTIEPDYDADISWLGRFTDRWEPGAIPNGSESRYDSRLLRWFVPAIGEDEHYRGLRALNYGRAEAHELARSYVLRDMETARDYAPVGAVLTVSREGVRLGEASLWSIDDEDYARSWDIVHDLTAEAIEQARDALARLCGGAS